MRFSCSEETKVLHLEGHEKADRSLIKPLMLHQYALPAHILQFSLVMRHRRGASAGATVPLQNLLNNAAMIRARLRAESSNIMQTWCINTQQRSVFFPLLFSLLFSLLSRRSAIVLLQHAVELKSRRFFSSSQLWVLICSRGPTLALCVSFARTVSLNRVLYSSTASTCKPQHASQALYSQKVKV